MGSGAGSPSRWQRTGGRVAFENPWIVVRDDEVLRPDGTPGVYGVVELRQPAVFVVAVTESTPRGEVVLVRCDRYTTGPGWEIPAGGAESDALEDDARRELAEEAGLVAEEWRDIGPVTSLNGICRAPGRVYLASELHAVIDDTVDVAAESAAEGISEVRLVPWPELLAMVGANEITDGETLAALMLAAQALGLFRT